MEPPCKDCENRSPGCHGRCETYLAYAEERRKISDARKQEAVYLDYVTDNAAKINKRLRRKRGVNHG